MEQPAPSADQHWRPVAVGVGDLRQRRVQDSDVLTRGVHSGVAAAQDRGQEVIRVVADSDGHQALLIGGMPQHLSEVETSLKRATRRFAAEIAPWVHQM